MFDFLTLADLYQLHTQLATDHLAAFRKLYDVNPADLKDATPKVGVFTDEWNILAAKMADLSQTAAAVFTEIDRRENEARADA